MPSGQFERLEQQRARREAERQRNPWDSATDISRREKALALRHKSRAADKLKAVIMCNSESDRVRLDAAICTAFRKFPSLINYPFRKCTPTFAGMPDLFSDMQRRHPQRPMQDWLRKGQTMSLTISHSAVSHGHVLHFRRIEGFDSSSRKTWPNYRRSPFTLACAFNRTEIARALVVEFKCDLGVPNVEEGLVLIDAHGRERSWRMTGFDLTVEFGCLATFDMLCALENTHPHVTAAIEYAGMEHADLRALCKRNERNKPTSQFDADAAVQGLELFATHDCKCKFCASDANIDA